MIYDHLSNESFCEKLESIQYKAVLAITGAVQGTSRENIFMELRLESLKPRRWLTSLCCVFKIMRNQAPEYLNNLIPKRSQSFNSRNLYTLSEEKNSAKNVELFCQSRKSDDYFYQRLIFTDKYSYRVFFLETRTFSIC